MDFLIVKQIGIALIIGMMIGLQREIHYQKKEKMGFAGTRTFALIALFGYVSAWMQLFIPLFFPLAFGVFGILVLLSYLKSEGDGVTTEMAAILTFSFGVMLYYSLEAYAILLAVMMLLLLGAKSDIARLKENITSEDWSNATLFLMMTFIVLPLLPDKMIDPFGIFNPYKTWLMVVLIAGISFVGYIATKMLGNQKGVYITAVFGGLASSTAVTIMLSKLYAVKNMFSHNLAGGIAIASTIMYARVLLETSFFNFSLTKALALPFLGATLAGVAVIFYFYKHDTPHTIEQTQVNSNPLALWEALKLGVLFGLIFGSIGIFQSKLGDSGVYLVSFLSGLTDVDAITLSLSQLALHEISQKTAIHGIIIATTVNSLVKLGIVFVVGGKKLGWLVSMYYLLTLSVLVGSILLGL